MNIIFNALNYILNYIFNITGDLGIAIILITILVRICLIPISIKQKKSMYHQQCMSKKIEDIKNKYGNNKAKLQQELQKCYTENAKSMLGCLISLLQLPIISSLYFVIMKMPISVGSILVPWVCSIKLPDPHFIIPTIYLFVSICPNLLSYIPYLNYLKSPLKNESVKLSLLTTSIFSLVLTVKAPIALGIYFITTGLFSLFEEIIYRIYMRKKALIKFSC
ncbi:membrane protein insertase YidC [Clostridium sp. KNHs214]|uniref:YidC/Oxa1 family membrane protein insertase n=1 Tax=Clostridium sp. KNHs214 TaxID=1540257 RepID=UPI0005551C0A|nr:membrane protein insertase YidC [Clostridium sp. KNHs214]